MIRFNLSGLLMAFVCGIAYGILTSLEVEEPQSIYIVVALMFGMDIVYRWRNDEEGVWKWLDGKAGGFLGITPVWITALILALLAGIGWL